MKYLSPASAERAKLSVYLYAQGQGKDAGQDGTAETAAESEPEEASQENQQPDVSANGNTPIDEATEIKDVCALKASLAVTPGARPVRDLSEYEDTDAKL